MTLVLSSLSDSCRAQISYWDVPGMRDLLVGADTGTRTPASSRALLIRATPSRYPQGYMQLSAMCIPICTGHGAQSCHIAPAPEGGFLVLAQPPPRAGPCWVGCVQISHVTSHFALQFYKTGKDWSKWRLVASLCVPGRQSHGQMDSHPHVCTERMWQIGELSPDLPAAQCLNVSTVMMNVFFQMSCKAVRLLLCSH